MSDDIGACNGDTIDSYNEVSFCECQQKCHLNSKCKYISYGQNDDDHEEENFQCLLYEMINYFVPIDYSRKYLTNFFQCYAKRSKKIPNLYLPQLAQKRMKSGFVGGTRVYSQGPALFYSMIIQHS